MLEAFSRGFFQDILTLMKELKKDVLTRNEIEEFIGNVLTIPSNKKALMKEMGWELKKPCKGCKDKKNERVHVHV